jgi:hypothetical protein
MSLNGGYRGTRQTLNIRLEYQHPWSILRMYCEETRWEIRGNWDIKLTRYIQTEDVRYLQSMMKWLLGKIN